MTARTATMSPAFSSRADDRPHLFRKLVLLFLLVTAAALGMLLLFRAKPNYPTWMQDWFAALVLAVVAGFGARWVLNRLGNLIRFIAATAAYLVGLYLLGLVSKWKYGIGPFEFWPRQIDLTGLEQVGAGLVIFLLVLLAWRRRDPLAAQAASALPPVANSRPAAPRPMPAPRPASNRAAARRSVLELWKPKVKPLKIGRNGWGRPRRGVKPMRASDIPVQPRRRNLFRGRPKVQIALVEEHRCPYCLEPVSRVDPRGVIECDVCHTLHHKDCWDITGVCQVPHLNT